MATKTHANGQDTVTLAGPQIPQLFEWVDIYPDLYPGFKLKVWANHPHVLMEQVWSGEGTKSFEALKLLAPEHNGWRDWEGNPMPPADTVEFWNDMPTQLFRLCIQAIEDARHVLPNLLRRTKLIFASTSAPSASPSQDQPTPPQG